MTLHPSMSLFYACVVVSLSVTTPFPILSSWAPSEGNFPSQTPKALAETARWMTHTSTWGYVTSFDQSGSPEKHLSVEVGSFSDGKPGASTGRLWFYIMARGVADTYAASLTMSQAAIRANMTCIVDGTAYDPEDPMCAKITIQGSMTRASLDDASIGKQALFARHPQMQFWPADHGFEVYELKIEDIWMIDFYGGGCLIPTKDYFANEPIHNVPKWPPSHPVQFPISSDEVVLATFDGQASSTHTFTVLNDPVMGGQSASTVAVDSAHNLSRISAISAIALSGSTTVYISDPPPHNKVAARARWLVYHSLWSSVGTVSVRLAGKPWGNVRSVADGVGKNSTGLPVFYLPTPDPTSIDITADSHATLSFSEASLIERVHPTSRSGMRCGGMDAEDPTCARLNLIGSLRALTEKSDVDQAKVNLATRHPLAPWLSTGGAHTGGAYYTIDVQSLLFLDYYGGPSPLTLKEYLAAELPDV